MDLYSDHAEISEKIDDDSDYNAKITDLDEEIKIEEEANIKSEVIEETNNFEPLQIIGEKRENVNRSTLENENKKIKAEFVVLEESDYKQETQDIKNLKFGDLNNQVITVLPKLMRRVIFMVNSF